MSRVCLWRSVFVLVRGEKFSAGVFRTLLAVYHTTCPGLLISSSPLSLAIVLLGYSNPTRPSRFSLLSNSSSYRARARATLGTSEQHYPYVFRVARSEPEPLWAIAVARDARTDDPGPAERLAASNPKPLPIPSRCAICSSVSVQAYWQYAVCTYVYAPRPCASARVTDARWRTRLGYQRRSVCHARSWQWHLRTCETLA